jgi:fructose/tagatose bisphosphate aldolase
MAELKNSLVISHSNANGNYFVKQGNKLIAGFSDKSDAELFIKYKINLNTMEKVVYITNKVSEIKPEIDKKVIGISVEKDVSTVSLSENGYWYSYEHECECDEPEYWLEEVSDNEEENIKQAIAFGYNTGFYNGRNNEDYVRPDNGEEYQEFIKELKL